MNRLWERLPPGDRQEIAQIVARMIAPQILPIIRQEGCDEYRIHNRRRAGIPTENRSYTVFKKRR